MSRHGYARVDSAFRSEYVAWRNMRRRCYYEKDSAYENYGGRGIKVCPQWRDDFQQFFDDVGPKPSPKHSLDRIDNDGDYEPGNVRWAVEKTQCRNKRSNVLVTWRGKTMTVVAWAERLGLKEDTLRRRLKMWPLKQAMTLQLWSRRGPKGRELIVDGKTMLVVEWAKVVGLHVRTVYARLERGYSDREAVYGK